MRCRISSPLSHMEFRRWKRPVIRKATNGTVLRTAETSCCIGSKKTRFSGEEACNFYIVVHGPSVSSTFYNWILKFSLLVHGTRVAVPADGREEITEFPPTLAGFWQLEYAYEIGLA